MSLMILYWIVLENFNRLYYDKFKDLIKNDRDAKLKHLKIFEDIIRWLNIYYNGSNPDYVSKYVLLKLEGKFIDN